MAKALVQSESGDWFLVPWDKRYDFYEDELEEDVEYEAIYVNPMNVKIIEYDYDV